MPTSSHPHPDAGSHLSASSPTLVAFQFGACVSLPPSWRRCSGRLTADSHSCGDQGRQEGTGTACLLWSPVDSPLESLPPESSPIVSLGRWTCLHGAWPGGEHSFICPFAPLEVKDLKVREGPWAFPEPTAHGALLSPHQAQLVTTQEGPGPTSQLRNQAQSIGGAARCTQTRLGRAPSRMVNWDSHPTGSPSAAGTFLGSKPHPAQPPARLCPGDGDGISGNAFSRSHCPRGVLTAPLLS